MLTFLVLYPDVTSYWEYPVSGIDVEIRKLGDYPTLESAYRALRHENTHLLEAVIVTPQGKVLDYHDFQERIFADWMRRYEAGETLDQKAISTLVSFKYLSDTLLNGSEDDHE